jgi:hypothetical protein
LTTAEWIYLPWIAIVVMTPIVAIYGAFREHGRKLLGLFSLLGKTDNDVLVTDKETENEFF